MKEPPIDVLHEIVEKRKLLLRELRRGSKWMRQRRQEETPSKSVLFIFGCQRSGTNMLARTLERAPHMWVYHEGERAAYDACRLRSEPIVERLVRRAHGRVVVFKPICDSHRADCLLEEYPQARAVWIYRRYQDVANSAARRWHDHFKQVIGWIKEGAWKRLGWRGERLTDEMKRQCCRLYRSDMTATEGAALFWWVRNQFFFTLGLHEDSRVLLVNYEDLVSEPGIYFPPVFSFSESVFAPEMTDRISDASVKKRSFPPICPEAEKLCEGTTKRLDTHLDRQEKRGRD